MVNKDGVWGLAAWIWILLKQVVQYIKYQYILYPNASDAEGTNSNNMDLLSNGFKCRENAAGTNQNTIIYMAFGQSLVGTNNVPCTAR